jgi:hypothetical protein
MQPLKINLRFLETYRLRFKCRRIRKARIQCEAGSKEYPLLAFVVYFFYSLYCFFTIYSRYLKRVISKKDGCVYLKQVPSIDGSLELI